MEDSHLSNDPLGTVLIGTLKPLVAMLFFVSLAMVFALLGILTLLTRRAGLALGVALLLLYPSSLVFNHWTYRGGLYAHDFYFLVLLVALPMRLVARPAPKAIIRDLTVLAAVFALGVSTLLLSGRPVDQYVLRDLRPFLLIMEGMVFWLTVQDRDIDIGPQAWCALGATAATSCFLGFALMRSGAISISDAYYEANLFRYFSVGSYSAAVWLLVSAGRWPSLLRSNPVALIGASSLCAGALLLAGMRGLLFATLIGLVVATRARPVPILGTALVAGLAASGFVALNSALQVQRVTDNLSLDGITAQLAGRFGPAVLTLDDMSTSERVTGSGLGTTFEIPWFEYRGLDPKNNSVDSTYLTMLAKFGAASVVFLFVLIRWLSYWPLPSATVRGLVALVVVLGVTMAIPYQKTAIGIPLMAILASRARAPRAAGP